MVSEEEIKILVNKQWLDKQYTIDGLLSLISQINVHSNEKLDTTNLNLVDAKSRIDNTNFRLDNTNLKLDALIALSGGEAPKKDILPGDIGVSLAKGSNGDIISCAINGIITNAIAKTDIAKHEKIIVVPGGNYDEPYVVSDAILIKGRESSGEIHPLHVDSNGDLVIIVTPGNTLYGEAIPTESCAAGAAIEFDVTSFSDLATLKQINVTQLTAGTYDYTLEIWEKDGLGYTPGTYTDHYLKIFSRDIDVREYSENIDQGLLYRDRDGSEELHCRLVNNAAGTTSTFNVTVVAINST